MLGTPNKLDSLTIVPPPLITKAEKKHKSTMFGMNLVIKILSLENFMP